MPPHQKNVEETRHVILNKGHPSKPVLDLAVSQQFNRGLAVRLTRVPRPAQLRMQLPQLTQLWMQFLPERMLHRNTGTLVGRKIPPQDQPKLQCGPPIVRTTLQNEVRVFLFPEHMILFLPLLEPSGLSGNNADQLLGRSSIWLPL